MSFEQIAADAFEKVQKKYRENSLKSSNKSYSKEAMASIEGIPDLRKGRKERYAARDKTHAARHPQGLELNAAFQTDTSGRSMDVVYGELLFKMTKPVLNCEELARMACFIASAKTDKFCVAALTPADHAFCMVGVNGDWVEKNGSRYALGDLIKSTWAGMYVVDVWLNVCCGFREYGEKAAAKLKLWTTKGKRISWIAPGEEEDSWTVPEGDYSKKFLASTLTNASA